VHIQLECHPLQLQPEWLCKLHGALTHYLWTSWENNEASTWPCTFKMLQYYGHYWKMVPLSWLPDLDVKAARRFTSVGIVNAGTWWTTLLVSIPFWTCWYTKSPMKAKVMLSHRLSELMFGKYMAVLWKTWTPPGASTVALASLWHKIRKEIVSLVATW